MEEYSNTYLLQELIDLAEETDSKPRDELEGHLLKINDIKNEILKRINST